MLTFFNKLCPETTAKVTGDMIKMTAHSAEDYRKIQRELESRKIPFRTMDPRSERPRKVLIRGLPVGTPVEDIKEALEQLRLIPLQIAHLKSRKIANKGEPLPLFVVTLSATPNFEDVYTKLETINYLKIKVEKFKNQPFRQCYNCQSFGHSSFTCKLPTKCLKCAGNHRSNVCKVKDEKGLKCANCGENHPSNYSGCEKHPSNKTATPAKIAVKPQPPRRNLATARTQKARTFSTPKRNPWDVLRDLEEDSEEALDCPSTSATNGQSKQQKRKYQAKNGPAPKKPNNNKPPPRGVSKHVPPKKDSSFGELFSLFREVRELMQTYNISDIVGLLKSCLQIFADPELEIIDKLAAVFETVTSYCSPLNSDV